MNKATHPEPWNLIPVAQFGESEQAHAALDECLALLDTAIESSLTPLMPVQRINVELFEELEPRD